MPEPRVKYVSRGTEGGDQAEMFPVLHVDMSLLDLKHTKPENRPQFAVPWLVDLVRKLYRENEELKKEDKSNAEFG